MLVLVSTLERQPDMNKRNEARFNRCIGVFYCWPGSQSRPFTANDVPSHCKNSGGVGRGCGVTLGVEVGLGVGVGAVRRIMKPQLAHREPIAIHEAGHFFVHIFFGHRVTSTEVGAHNNRSENGWESATLYSLGVNPAARVSPVHAGALTKGSLDAVVGYFDQSSPLPRRANPS